jgi:hypothetical protein
MSHNDMEHLMLITLLVGCCNISTVAEALIKVFACLSANTANLVDSPKKADNLM